MSALRKVRAELRKNRGRSYTVLPLMPVEERLHVWQNRRAIAANTARENAEVARQLAVLGTRPYADIVTVMATKDRPEMARAAVESALAQDVDSHLVVVVNDGGERPKLPEDDRVLQIDLPQSMRCVGATRNIGIRCTASRLIAILDDDNTWSPTHLSSTLGAFDAGATLAYTGVQWVSETGADLGVLNRPYHRPKLAHSNYIDANSIVAVRSADTLFSRMPRKKLSFTAEDWEFVWRNTRRGRAVHIPEISVNYLRNSSSTLSQHDDWLPTEKAS